MSTKKIPGWYRIYLERRLAKLESGLIQLDHAENMLSRGYLLSASCFIKFAKNTLKVR